MSEKVVIIGSGPAGWTAAIYASRAGLKPVVFEGAINQENQMRGTLPLGQLALTTEVENYPGFPPADLAGYLDAAIPADRRGFMAPHGGHGVSGPELMELMRAQAVAFGTRIVTDDIVELDVTKHPFQMRSLEGQSVEAAAVIVATGARANYLGLPSEDLYKNRGVSACAVCDGALPRFRNQPLIVVGGGDSAMEEASYLAKFASQVHLVHRRGEFRASKIMGQRVLSNPKIQVHWFRTVEEVAGSEAAGVTGATLVATDDSGAREEIAAAGFFVAIGHTPNTDFLRNKVELDPKGYVVWTAPFRTLTSVAGVFAAGDVADSRYRQAITAAASGCMAALDAERWLTEEGL